MKTLIFITSRFPYEPGEAFVGPEFSFLHPAFDRMIIITRDVRSGKKRTIPPDVKTFRYNPASSWLEYLLIPWLILSNIKKVLILIVNELRFRSETGRRINFIQKLFLIKSIVKSLQLRDFIKKVIKNEKPEGELVLYSYWMNSGARAISMLDDIRGLKIARAHRIDLYEEETDQNYIPLVKNTFDNLHSIFFISEHGKKYFESKYDLISEKNIISRLGVINDYPFNPKVPENEIFRVVTCSNLIGVKRVHLVIKALEKVKTHKKIIWTHFGGGPLMEELTDMAEQVFGNSEKIQYIFSGNVLNADILKFYSENHTDLFINTSSSEGIPVSIMEAQSFGIPVIATDTGGTGEIVRKGTGILLPADFEIEDLARQIEYLLHLENHEKVSMKKDIYDNWRTNFNAYSNLEYFVRRITELSASADN